MARILLSLNTAPARAWTIGGRQRALLYRAIQGREFRRAAVEVVRRRPMPHHQALDSRLGMREAATWRLQHECQGACLAQEFLGLLDLDGRTGQAARPYPRAGKNDDGDDNDSDTTADTG